MGLGVCHQCMSSWLTNDCNQGLLGVAGGCLKFRNVCCQLILHGLYMVMRARSVSRVVSNVKQPEYSALCTISDNTTTI